MLHILLGYLSVNVCLFIMFKIYVLSIYTCIYIVYLKLLVLIYACTCCLLYFLHIMNDFCIVLLPCHHPVFRYMYPC